MLETTSVVGGLPRIHLGAVADLETSGLPRDRNGQPLVARVNGQEVTLSAFQRKEAAIAQQQGLLTAGERSGFRGALARRVLDEVIDDELIRQFARKHAIRVTEQAVTDRIRATNEHLPPGRKLQDEANRLGRTLSDLREQIRDEILWELCEDRMLFSVSPPTDLEVEQHLKAGGQIVTGTQEIRLSRILIRPPTDLPTMQAAEAAVRRAESVLAEIRSGLEFAEAARNYSDDPLTSGAGGDIGYFLPDMLLAEYRPVVSNMKVGEISGIIRTPVGCHILMLTDRREGDVMTRLRRLRARTALTEEIAAMRRKARIEYYLQIPETGGK
jgi:peptidyl-prolyl cis-trans isomerase SurA